MAGLILSLPAPKWAKFYFLHLSHVSMLKPLIFLYSKQWICTAHSKLKFALVTYILVLW